MIMSGKSILEIECVSPDFCDFYTLKMYFKL